jgi:hypothetical protein
MRRISRFLAALAFAICSIAYADAAIAATDWDDIVCEQSDSTGQGDLELDGALPDYLPFSALIASGSTLVPISIVASDGKVETATVTYTDASPDTLTSRVASASSDGAGAELDLPAGTHQICVTLTTELLKRGTGSLLNADLLDGITSADFVADADLGTGVGTFLGTPSSANFAAALTNETGSGAAVFATSPVLTTPNLGTPSTIVLTNGTGLTTAGMDAAALVTAAEGLASSDNDTSVPTTAAVINAVQEKIESFVVAASDETTAITANADKVTFRMPYAFTVTEVFCSLNVANASGADTQVDINENNVSILSTPITFDDTETTTLTAAVPPVISDASIAKGAEVEIDVDAAGGSGLAAGLKCNIIGHQ